MSILSEPQSAPSLAPALLHDISSTLPSSYSRVSFPTALSGRPGYVSRGAGHPHVSSSPRGVAGLVAGTSFWNTGSVLLQVDSARTILNPSCPCTPSLSTRWILDNERGPGGCVEVPPTPPVSEQQQGGGEPGKADPNKRNSKSLSNDENTVERLSK